MDKTAPVLRKLPSALGENEYKEMFRSWIDESGTQLTASHIHNVLGNAWQGYSQDQSRLFKTVMEKEAVIRAHMQTRILAVTGAKWDVIGDDNEAKCKEIYKILEQADLNSLMSHLLLSVAYGYSGAFIDWKRGGGSIEKFPAINIERFEFDRYGNKFLINDHGMRVAFEDYNPNQLIFHEYNGATGIPSQRGLLRTLIWLYFFKNFSFKHKARYIEKFGIPFLITQISDTDFANDTVRENIKDSLRNIGADGIGVVTKGTEIKPFEAPQTSTNADIGAWLKYIDDTITLVIIGQLASSAVAGGMSNGQIQENVRDDIKKSDALSLMRTITNNVIRPLEFFKYGTQNMSFVIDTDPPEDLKKKGELITALKNAGFTPDSTWIEKTFGIPMQKIDVAKPAMGGLPATAPSLPLGLGSPSGAPPPASGEGAPTPEQSQTEAGQPEVQPTNDLPLKKKLVAFSDINDDLRNVISSATIPDDLKARFAGKLTTDEVRLEIQAIRAELMAKVDEEGIAIPIDPAVDAGLSAIDNYTYTVDEQALTAKPEEVKPIETKPEVPVVDAIEPVKPIETIESVQAEPVKTDEEKSPLEPATKPFEDQPKPSDEIKKEDSSLFTEKELKVKKEIETVEPLIEEKTKDEIIGEKIDKQEKSFASKKKEHEDRIAGILPSVEKKIRNDVLEIIATYDADTLSGYDIGKMATEKYNKELPEDKKSDTVDEYLVDRIMPEGEIQSLILEKAKPKEKSESVSARDKEDFDKTPSKEEQKNRIKESKSIKGKEEWLIWVGKNIATPFIESMNYQASGAKRKNLSEQELQDQSKTEARVEDAKAEELIVLKALALPDEDRVSYILRQNSSIDTPEKFADAKARKLAEIKMQNYIKSLPEDKKILPVDLIDKARKQVSNVNDYVTDSELMNIARYVNAIDGDPVIRRAKARGIDNALTYEKVVDAKDNSILTNAGNIVGKYATGMKQLAQLDIKKGISNIASSTYDAITIPSKLGSRQIAPVINTVRPIGGDSVIESMMRDRIKDAYMIAVTARKTNNSIALDPKTKQLLSLEEVQNRVLDVMDQATREHMRDRAIERGEQELKTGDMSPVVVWKNANQILMNEIVNLNNDITSIRMPMLEEQRLWLAKKKPDDQEEYTEDEKKKISDLEKKINDRDQKAIEDKGIMDLESTYKSLNQPKSNTGSAIADFVGDGFYSAVGMAPAMITSMAFGSLLRGAKLAQMTGKGFTESKAIVKGAEKLQGFGTSLFWTKISHEQVYQDCIQKGIDPKTANFIAFASGLPMGYLEHFNTKMMEPWVTKAALDLTRLQTKKFINHYAKDAGVNFIAENAIEFAQDLTQVLGTNLAYLMDDKKNPNTFSGDIYDFLAQRPNVAMSLMWMQAAPMAVDYTAKKTSFMKDTAERIKNSDIKIQQLRDWISNEKLKQKYNGIPTEYQRDLEKQLAIEIAIKDAPTHEAEQKILDEQNVFTDKEYHRLAMATNRSIDQIKELPQEDLKKQMRSYSILLTTLENMALAKKMPISSVNITPEQFKTWDQTKTEIDKMNELGQSSLYTEQIPKQMRKQLLEAEKKRLLQSNKNIQEKEKSGQVEIKIYTSEDVAQIMKDNPSVVLKDNATFISDKATGKSKVFINAEKIVTREDLIRVFTHEDFIHRFLMGEQVMSEIAKNTILTALTERVKTNDAEAKAMQDQMDKLEVEIDTETDENVRIKKNVELNVLAHKLDQFYDRKITSNVRNTYLIHVMSKLSGIDLTLEESEKAYAKLKGDAKLKADLELSDELIANFIQRDGYEYIKDQVEVKTWLGNIKQFIMDKFPKLRIILKTDKDVFNLISDFYRIYRTNNYNLMDEKYLAKYEEKPEGEEEIPVQRNSLDIEYALVDKDTNDRIQKRHVTEFEIGMQETDDIKKASFILPNGKLLTYDRDIEANRIPASHQEMIEEFGNIDDPNIKIPAFILRSNIIRMSFKNNELALEIPSTISSDQIDILKNIIKNDIIKNISLDIIGIKDKINNYNALVGITNSFYINEYEKKSLINKITTATNQTEQRNSLEPKKFYHDKLGRAEAKQQEELINDKDRRVLTRKYGYDNLHSFVRKYNLAKGISDLTESQARFILSRGDLDSIARDLDAEKEKTEPIKPIPVVERTPTIERKVNEKNVIGTAKAEFKRKVDRDNERLSSKLAQEISEITSDNRIYTGVDSSGNAIQISKDGNGYVKNTVTNGFNADRQSYDTIGKLVDSLDKKTHFVPFNRAFSESDHVTTIVENVQRTVRDIVPSFFFGNMDNSFIKVIPSVDQLGKDKEEVGRNEDIHVNKNNGHTYIIADRYRNKSENDIKLDAISAMASYDGFGSLVLDKQLLREAGLKYYDSVINLDKYASMGLNRNSESDMELLGEYVISDLVSKGEVNKITKKAIAEIDNALKQRNITARQMQISQIIEESRRNISSNDVKDFISDRRFINRNMSLNRFTDSGEFINGMTERYSLTPDKNTRNDKYTSIQSNNVGGYHLRSKQELSQFFDAMVNSTRINIDNDNYSIDSLPVEITSNRFTSDALIQLSAGSFAEDIISDYTLQINDINADQSRSVNQKKDMYKLQDAIQYINTHSISFTPASLYATQKIKNDNGSLSLIDMDKAISKQVKDIIASELNSNANISKDDYDSIVKNLDGMTGSMAYSVIGRYIDDLDNIFAVYGYDGVRYTKPNGDNSYILYSIGEHEALARMNLPLSYLLMETEPNETVNNNGRYQSEMIGSSWKFSSLYQDGLQNTPRGEYAELCNDITKNMRDINNISNLLQVTNLTIEHLEYSRKSLSQEDIEFLSSSYRDAMRYSNILDDKAEQIADKIEFGKRLIPEVQQQAESDRKISGSISESQSGNDFLITIPRTNMTVRYSLSDPEVITRHSFNVGRETKDLERNVFGVESAYIYTIIRGVMKNRKSNDELANVFYKDKKFGIFGELKGIQYSIKDTIADILTRAKQNGFINDEMTQKVSAELNALYAEFERKRSLYNQSKGELLLSGKQDTFEASKIPVQYSPIVKFFVKTLNSIYNKVYADPESWAWKLAKYRKVTTETYDERRDLGFQYKTDPNSEAVIPVEQDPLYYSPLHGETSDSIMRPQADEFGEFHERVVEKTDKIKNDKVEPLFGLMEEEKIYNIIKLLTVGDKNADLDRLDRFLDFHKPSIDTDLYDALIEEFNKIAKKSTDRATIQKGLTNIYEVLKKRKDEVTDNFYNTFMETLSSIKKQADRGKEVSLDVADLSDEFKKNTPSIDMTLYEKFKEGILIEMQNRENPTAENKQLALDYFSYTPYNRISDVIKKEIVTLVKKIYGTDLATTDNKVKADLQAFLKSMSRVSNKESENRIYGIANKISDMKAKGSSQAEIDKYVSDELNGMFKYERNPASGEIVYDYYSINESGDKIPVTNLKGMAEEEISKLVKEPRIANIQHITSDSNVDVVKNQLIANPAIYKTGEEAINPEQEITVSQNVLEIDPIDGQPTGKFKFDPVTKEYVKVNKRKKVKDVLDPNTEVIMTLAIRDMFMLLEKTMMFDGNPENTISKDTLDNIIKYVNILYIRSLKDGFQGKLEDYLSMGFQLTNVFGKSFEEDSNKELAGHTFTRTYNIIKDLNDFLNVVNRDNTSKTINTFGQFIGKDRATTNEVSAVISSADDIKRDLTFKDLTGKSKLVVDAIKAFTEGNVSEFQKAVKAINLNLYDMDKETGRLKAPTISSMDTAILSERTTDKTINPDKDMFEVDVDTNDIPDFMSPSMISYISAIYVNKAKKQLTDMGYLTATMPAVIDIGNGQTAQVTLLFSKDKEGNQFIVKTKVDDIIDIRLAKQRNTADKTGLIDPKNPLSGSSEVLHIIDTLGNKGLNEDNRDIFADKFAGMSMKDAYSIDKFSLDGFGQWMKDNFITSDIGYALNNDYNSIKDFPSVFRTLDAYKEALKTIIKTYPDLRKADNFTTNGVMKTFIEQNDVLVVPWLNSISPNRFWKFIESDKENILTMIDSNNNKITIKYLNREDNTYSGNSYLTNHQNRLVVLLMQNGLTIDQAINVISKGGSPDFKSIPKSDYDYYSTTAEKIEKIFAGRTEILAVLRKLFRKNLLSETTSLDDKIESAKLVIQNLSFRELRNYVDQEAIINQMITKRQILFSKEKAKLDDIEELKNIIKAGTAHKINRLWYEYTQDEADSNKKEWSNISASVEKVKKAQAEIERLQKEIETAKRDKVIAILNRGQEEYSYEAKRKGTTISKRDIEKVRIAMVNQILNDPKRSDVNFMAGQFGDKEFGRLTDMITEKENTISDYNRILTLIKDNTIPELLNEISLLKTDNQQIEMALSHIKDLAGLNETNTRIFNPIEISKINKLVDNGSDLKYAETLIARTALHMEIVSLRQSVLNTIATLKSENETLLREKERLPRFSYQYKDASGKRYASESRTISVNKVIDSLKDYIDLSEYVNAIRTYELQQRTPYMLFNKKWNRENKDIVDVIMRKYNKYVSILKDTENINIEKMTVKQCRDTEKKKEFVNRVNFAINVRDNTGHTKTSTNWIDYAGRYKKLMAKQAEIDKENLDNFGKSQGNTVQTYKPIEKKTLEEDELKMLNFIKSNLLIYKDEIDFMKTPSSTDKASGRAYRVQKPEEMNEYDLIETIEDKKRLVENYDNIINSASTPSENKETAIKERDAIQSEIVALQKEQGIKEEIKDDEETGELKEVTIYPFKGMKNGVPQYGMRRRYQTNDGENKVKREAMYWIYKANSNALQVNDNIGEAEDKIRSVVKIKGNEYEVIIDKDNSRMAFRPITGLEVEKKKKPQTMISFAPLDNNSLGDMKVINSDNVLDNSKDLVFMGKTENTGNVNAVTKLKESNSFKLQDIPILSTMAYDIIETGKMLHNEQNPFAQKKENKKKAILEKLTEDSVQKKDALKAIMNTVDKMAKAYSESDKNQEDVNLVREQVRDIALSINESFDIDTVTNMIIDKANTLVKISLLTGKSADPNVSPLEIAEEKKTLSLKSDKISEAISDAMFVPAVKNDVQITNKPVDSYRTELSENKPNFRNTKSEMELNWQERNSKNTNDINALIADIAKTIAEDKFAKEDKLTVMDENAPKTEFELLKDKELDLKTKLSKANELLNEQNEKIAKLDIPYSAERVNLDKYKRNKTRQTLENQKDKIELEIYLLERDLKSLQTDEHYSNLRKADLDEHNKKKEIKANKLQTYINEETSRLRSDVNELSGKMIDIDRKIALLKENMAMQEDKVKQFNLDNPIVNDDEKLRERDANDLRTIELAFTEPIAQLEKDKLALAEKLAYIRFTNDTQDVFAKTIDLIKEKNALVIEGEKYSSEDKSSMDNEIQLKRSSIMHDVKDSLLMPDNVNSSAVIFEKLKNSFKSMGIDNVLNMGSDHPSIDEEYQCIISIDDIPYMQSARSEYLIKKIRSALTSNNFAVLSYNGIDIAKIVKEAKQAGIILNVDKILKHENENAFTLFYKGVGEQDKITQQYYVKNYSFDEISRYIKQIAPDVRIDALTDLYQDTLLISKNLVNVEEVKGLLSKKTGRVINPRAVGIHSDNTLIFKKEYLNNNGDLKYRIKKFFSNADFDLIYYNADTNDILLFEVDSMDKPFPTVIGICEEGGLMKTLNKQDQFVIRKKYMLDAKQDVENKEANDNLDVYIYKFMDKYNTSEKVASQYVTRNSLELLNEKGLRVKQARVPRGEFGVIIDEFNVLVNPDEKAIVFKKLLDLRYGKENITSNLQNNIYTVKTKDGQKIIFDIFKRSKNWNIWRVEVDGKEYDTVPNFIYKWKKEQNLDNSSNVIKTAYQLLKDAKRPSAEEMKAYNEAELKKTEKKILDYDSSTKQLMDKQYSREYVDNDFKTISDEGDATYFKRKQLSLNTVRAGNVRVIHNPVSIQKHKIEQGAVKEQLSVGDIVIPLFNLSDWSIGETNPQMYQYIDTHKPKKKIKDPKTGKLKLDPENRIGKPESPSYAYKNDCFSIFDPDRKLNKNYKGRIYIVEGFATGASVFEINNQGENNYVPVICSENVNRIGHAVNETKKYFKDAEIVICADRDEDGNKNPIDNPAGSRKGEKHAIEVIRRFTNTAYFLPQGTGSYDMSDWFMDKKKEGKDIETIRKEFNSMVEVGKRTWDTRNTWAHKINDVGMDSEYNRMKRNPTMILERPWQNINFSEEDVIAKEAEKERQQQDSKQEESIPPNEESAKEETKAEEPKAEPKVFASRDEAYTFLDAKIQDILKNSSDIEVVAKEVDNLIATIPQLQTIVNRRIFINIIDQARDASINADKHSSKPNDDRLKQFANKEKKKADAKLLLFTNDLATRLFNMQNESASTDKATEIKNILQAMKDLDGFTSDNRNGSNNKKMPSQNSVGQVMEIIALAKKQTLEFTKDALQKFYSVNFDRTEKIESNETLKAGIEGNPVCWWLAGYSDSLSTIPERKAYGLKLMEDSIGLMTPVEKEFVEQAIVIFKATQEEYAKNSANVLGKEFKIINYFIRPEDRKNARPIKIDVNELVNTTVGELNGFHDISLFASSPEHKEQWLNGIERKPVDFMVAYLNDFFVIQNLTNGISKKIDALDKDGKAITVEDIRVSSNANRLNQINKKLEELKNLLADNSHLNYDATKKMIDFDNYLKIADDIQKMIEVYSTFSQKYFTVSNHYFEFNFETIQKNLRYLSLFGSLPGISQLMLSDTTGSIDNLSKVNDIIDSKKKNNNEDILLQPNEKFIKTIQDAIGIVLTDQQVTQIKVIAVKDILNLIREYSTNCGMKIFVPISREEYSTLYDIVIQTPDRKDDNTWLLKGLMKYTSNPTSTWKLIDQKKFGSKSVGAMMRVNSQFVKGTADTTGQCAMMDHLYSILMEKLKIKRTSAEGEHLTKINEAIQEMVDKENRYRKEDNKIDILYFDNATIIKTLENKFNIISTDNEITFIKATLTGENALLHEAEAKNKYHILKKYVNEKGIIGRRTFLQTRGHHLTKQQFTAKQQAQFDAMSEIDKVKFLGFDTEEQDSLHSKNYFDQLSYINLMYFKEKNLAPVVAIGTMIADYMDYMYEMKNPEKAVGNIPAMSPIATFLRMQIDFTIKGNTLPLTEWIEKYAMNQPEKSGQFSTINEMMPRSFNPFTRTTFIKYGMLAPITLSGELVNVTGAGIQMLDDRMKKHYSKEVDQALDMFRVGVKNVRVRTMKNWMRAINTTRATVYISGNWGWSIITQPLNLAVSLPYFATRVPFTFAHNLLKSAGYVVINTPWEFFTGHNASIPEVIRKSKYASLVLFANLEQARLNSEFRLKRFAPDALRKNIKDGVDTFGSGFSTDTIGQGADFSQREHNQMQTNPVIRAMNKMFMAPGNVIETALDLLVYECAIADAKKQGIETKEDQDIYAGAHISTLNAVFNRSSRAFVLNDESYTLINPFQSYSFMMMNLIVDLINSKDARFGLNVKVPSIERNETSLTGFELKWKTHENVIMLEKAMRLSGIFTALTTLATSSSIGYKAMFQGIWSLITWGIASITGDPDKDEVERIKKRDAFIKNYLAVFPSAVAQVFPEPLGTAVSLVVSSPNPNALRSKTSGMYPKSTDMKGQTYIPELTRLYLILVAKTTGQTEATEASRLLLNYINYEILEDEKRGFPWTDELTLLMYSYCALFIGACGISGAPEIKNTVQLFFDLYRSPKGYINTIAGDNSDLNPDEKIGIQYRYNKYKRDRDEMNLDISHNPFAYLFQMGQFIATGDRGQKQTLKGTELTADVPVTIDIQPIEEEDKKE